MPLVSKVGDDTEPHKSLKKGVTKVNYWSIFLNKQNFLRRWSSADVKLLSLISKPYPTSRPPPADWPTHVFCACGSHLTTHVISSFNHQPTRQVKWMHAKSVKGWLTRQYCMIKRAVVFYIREEGSHFAKGEGGTLFVKKKLGIEKTKKQSLSLLFLLVKRGSRELTRYKGCSSLFPFLREKRVKSRFLVWFRWRF